MSIFPASPLAQAAAAAPAAPVSPRVQVQSVRATPAGFDHRVQGLCTFVMAWTPTDGALVLTRPAKNKTTGEWREYETARVIGATGVQVADAQIWTGDRGAWLKVNGMQLPRDVSDAVCSQALAMMAQQGIRPPAPPAAPAAGNGDGR